jgi:dihydrolipoamide dehydrogenase
MFDLIVIGSGPAGYVGAIGAAQKGLSVAIIEKENWLGGTCLNVGCIPTKALLYAASEWQKMQKLESLGIQATVHGFDYKKFFANKEKIVLEVNQGVQFLLKKNKVKIYRGTGSVHEVVQNADSPCVHVAIHTTEGSLEIIQGSKVLLAAGSSIRSVPSLPVDHVHVLNSDSVLQLQQVPKTMVVVGGGVIGCEFASLFSRLGCQVTILEVGKNIIPFEDADTRAEFIKQLQKDGVIIHTGVQIQSCVSQDAAVSIVFQDTNQTTQKMVTDKALISIGRIPNTHALGLEKATITVDERGFVPVNLESYQTSCPLIYAVGDLITTPQLAHTASREALAAVDYIVHGHKQSINYLANPNVVYSYPEIASVGHTEEALQNSNRPYKVSKFPFSAIAKAKIEHSDFGFIKLLTCPETQEILGAHIVHPKASEMISHFVLGKQAELTIEELANTIFPHPSLSETILEASHAAFHKAIHI